ncbi:hypothetical protein P256_02352 [Acinetobacter nectaris CIP 110549]|uniref:D-amino-acid oxidase n=1 Tax=Acinetobacter nectaris CIP 110549 TaxID=1392540 RepID=V2TIK2_9GAMM|nr:FAD-dependent oxidoreductase [Acinetobacter nectaris]ESK37297.1 hypothetical protein P256_02352 [Acinetobacter nectaris CIP 110549]
MKWSILGNGVTGLCIAVELTKMGEKCEVITSDITAASHWAGGMLAPYCETESAPSYVTEQGIKAISWWSSTIPLVHQNGTLVIAPARDIEELNRFSKMTDQHTWVRPQDIESDISDHFERGLFFSEEAHLDPRYALSQLREFLVSKGVPFHQSKPSGTIVDCRGIAAQDSLSDLRAVRGEMLILETHDIHFSRPIRFLHPRFPCYLVPRDNGRFMLGATMLESNDHGKISVRAVLELLTSTYVINPAFAEAKIIETGAGLRPSFPSNLPEIKFKNGKYFVNGMYRHGFLLAPIIAQNFIARLKAK